MLRTFMRVGMGILGVVMAVLAVAFYFRWPIVADIWPWGGYYTSGLSPLSFYFLSSIAAAVCLPFLWIALSDKLHAATPGALNLLVTFIGISVFMFQSYTANTDNTRLLWGAVLLGGTAVSSGIVYLLGRNMPIHDLRPLPTPIRLSFYGFIIALIIAGGALVLKMPNILPWEISPEGSIVYGWIFLGASCYFIFAVLNPRWENATGQLIGFLAYDVVLILPFINHFSTVAPEHRNSLIIYIIVVVYSAILAIYYLFIDRATRLFGSAIPVSASTTPA